ncbi:MAG: lipocalin-like domain-containing protein [Dehalococcoidia bacterium]|nr:lipocalin-like domain-containing protein [Dehalococcoidia bacterium]
MAGSATSKRLLGLWRLVSLRTQAPGRPTEYPLGKNPVGIISYYPSGHMSVHLMRRGRKRFASNDARQVTVEEKAAAYDSFGAYFGKFEVKPKEKAVYHLVEGASFPNMVGTAQKRLYEFRGRRLTLRAIADLPEGGQSVTQVVWERAV